MNIQDNAAEQVTDRRQKREAPSTHFARVAKSWEAILGHEVSAEKVVLCMVALKLVREAGSLDLGTSEPDNMIDAIGYASLYPEVFGISTDQTPT